MKNYYGRHESVCARSIVLGCLYWRHSLDINVERISSEWATLFHSVICWLSLWPCGGTDCRHAMYVRFGVHSGCCHY